MSEVSLFTQESRISAKLQHDTKEPTPAIHNLKPWRDYYCCAVLSTRYLA